MTVRVQIIRQWTQARLGLIAAAIVGVIVGCIAPTLVRAAIPDGNTIHACYATAAGPFGLTPKGDVRIIDSTETCPSGTVAINWDQHATGGGMGGFVSNLAGADLGGSDFRYRSFVGADMHNVLFGSTLFNGSDFHDANLSGVTIGAKAALAGVNFHNTNFSGATMGVANDITTLTFSGDVTGANFSSTVMGKVSFAGGLSMTGVSFANAQLTKVNFTGTNLTPATLTGVTWVNSTCPDGTNSDINGNTCNGHLVP